MREPTEHGFTRVDREARPSDWIDVLDRLQREPFYRAYKERVREILSPRPTGLYLEVGAGAGSDALALGARVIGVDSSQTMCREARARGLSRVVKANAEALPLPSDLVDGGWGDRTFQHLADPGRALAELVRVMKVGATLVVVDPDYGTQAMDFPDLELAQKVLAFRAHHALRNGTLAGRMGQCFGEAGLCDVATEERVLVVRDPTAVDNVMGLRSWARAALACGMMSEAEAQRFEALYDRVVADGSFRWSVSFFITSGRKAASTPPPRTP